MKFERANYTDDQLLEVYHRLVLPRMIEEKMLIYLRQGKISKWFSGYGQEAVSVGCAMALDQDEYILTMHRNLGVFTTRNVPLERLFAQFQGKAEGFTKGRDRSFHFGSKQHVSSFIRRMYNMYPLPFRLKRDASSAVLTGINRRHFGSSITYMIFWLERKFTQQI